MYPQRIKIVHIELTNRCQAACPMCARNHNGGRDKEHLSLTEITLTDFKQWFPPEFLKELSYIYACGNYGDPIIAKDCLEIFQYIRESNPSIGMGLHTNGGAKNKEWWESLARAMGTQGHVTFAIDGFKGQHELYRRGTNFDHVIENAKAFINAGGQAFADSLVFAHNEHSTDDLEKFLKGLGFLNVNFKSTKRFYHMTEFAVEDKNGNFDYNLKPAQLPQWKQEVKINVDMLKSKDSMKKFTQGVTIEPECAKLSQIYVDCHGRLFPCCWTASDYQEPIVYEDDSVFTFVRNEMFNDTKSLMNSIGVPSLVGSSMTEILSSTTLWNDLHQRWESDDKPIECVKSCSTKLYDTLYKHTVKQKE